MTSSMILRTVWSTSGEDSRFIDRSAVKRSPKSAADASKRKVMSISSWKFQLS